MGKYKALVVDIDGEVRDNPDFPVAIKRDSEYDGNLRSVTVDPVFTFQVRDNLYGRIMTLVEATTDPNKLKAVKDVFSKEINEWAGDVYQSAREIAEGGNSSSNIYKR